LVQGETFSGMSVIACIGLAAAEEEFSGFREGVTEERGAWNQWALGVLISAVGVIGRTERRWV